MPLQREPLRKLSINVPIVCICGSMRFARQMGALEREYTLGGWIVVGPCVMPADVDAEIKKMLDELHLDKIDLASHVHFANVEGYMGESTKRELAYAMMKNKPLRFWEGDKAHRWIADNKSEISELQYKFGRRWSRIFVQAGA